MTAKNGCLHLEVSNLEKSKYLPEILLNLVNIVVNRNTFDETGYVEICKRIKSIIVCHKEQAGFNEREKNKLDYCMYSLQKRLLFQNESNIAIVLEVFYNKDMAEYLGEYINTVSELKQKILKIIDTYPLDGFILGKSDIDTLRNYFSLIKDTFEADEYEFAKEGLLSYMKQIMSMLDIMEVWIDEPIEKKRGKYYDDLTGEFDSSILNNSDNFQEGLRELKSYFLKNLEDKKAGEALLELIFALDRTIKANSDFWGQNKKIIIDELCDLYKLMEEKNVSMSSFYGERWTHGKVRILIFQRQKENSSSEEMKDKE